ncbi:MAG: FxsA family protein [Blastocatellia bacterium]
MKLLGKLFLLFTIITAVETYLLVLLTQYTNIWATIAMIIVPGMLGAYLAKREGRQAISRIKAALRLEQEPTTAVLDGALLLVAAAFLITPGVLSDLTGLLLMIPAVRRPIREYIKNRVKQMVESQISGGAMKVFSLPFGMNVDNFSRRDENVIDIKVEK